jgi:Ribbon-helix-helix protein, copG family
MDNRQTGLSRLTTRVDSETLAEIERMAKARRTNVAQVARCLIEDALRA